MDPLYDRLQKMIRSMVDVPEKPMYRMMEIFIPRTIKKGDFFIQAGSISNKIGFNGSGLFRYYYTDDKGKEYTNYLCPEGKFLVSYSAMLLKCESAYTIEALEDSEILTANCVDFYGLAREDSCWQLFVQKLLEDVFIFHERREKALILDSALERYFALLEEYPGIEKRMKQYQIASYLGITPVALSRIRRKCTVLNQG